MGSSEKLSSEKLSYAMYRNYMPYAEEVILLRAIPALDGFKPVQRRTVFGLHKLGAYSKNIKSARIVGDVMGKYHPHGDSSIYEALCMMTNKYNGLNIPYVLGTGYFGYISDESSAAAMRYTEVRLEPVSKELFDGINEDAIDMVDNFDGTEKEPSILPVKFPTILVSTTSGVAVGMSSNIPSFNLKNVCDATIGVVNGQITSPKELAEKLGSPEFTTGGTLHCSESSLESLCKTGKGKFVLDGTAAVYPNEIVIYEVPYSVTAEKLIEETISAVKDGRLENVRDVDNLSDKAGFKVVVQIKRGADPNKVLNDLYRTTSLRKRISFNTNVIIDNKPMELGILDLVKKWIQFREGVLLRQYTFRYNDKEKERSLMEAWGKIDGHIPEVANIVADNKHDDAKVKLIEKFGLTEEQVKYLLDFKLYQLTVDRAEKGIQDFHDLEKEVEYLKGVISGKEGVDNIIVSELEYIRDKYGYETRTQIGDELTEEDLAKPETVISDEVVQIAYTKKGYVKRLVSFRDMNSFSVPAGDEEILRIAIKNNENLLVFTYGGEVYKVPAYSIDAGRGLTEQLYSKLGLISNDDIMFIDKAGDYSDSISIVYSNGRYVKLFYSKIAGNRQKYISLYEPSKPGYVVVTKESDFLVITNKFKASVAHVGFIGANRKKSCSSRICRVSTGEGVIGVVPLSVVSKDISDEYIKDKYSKDYTVLIRDDKLWSKADDIKNDIINPIGRQIIETVYEAHAKLNAPVVEQNSEGVVDDTEVKEV